MITDSYTVHDYYLIDVDSMIGSSGYKPVVIFTLHLRRLPLYYIVNLIVPCCLLSLIAVAAFLLQPGSSERLGISNLRLYVLLLT